MFGELTTMRSSRVRADVTVRRLGLKAWRVPDQRTEFGQWLEGTGGQTPVVNMFVGGREMARRSSCRSATEIPHAKHASDCL